MIGNNKNLPLGILLDLVLMAKIKQTSFVNDWLIIFVCKVLTLSLDITRESEFIPMVEIINKGTSPIITINLTIAIRSGNI